MSNEESCATCKFGSPCWYGPSSKPNYVDCQLNPCEVRVSYWHWCGKFVPATPAQEAERRKAEEDHVAREEARNKEIAARRERDEETERMANALRPWVESWVYDILKERGVKTSRRLRRKHERWLRRNT